MSVERNEPVRDPVARPPVTGRVTVADRVRWGPIVAGLLTTITVLLMLGLLGTAIGMTVFDEGVDGRVIGTTAAVWGVITLFLAFLAGGWVAAWSAGMTDDADALFNGLMVAIAGIVVLLWLVGSGLGYLFGAVTANLELIAEVGRGLAAGDVDAAAAQTAFEDARAGTWGTLGGLVFALAAAAFGGWLGQRTVVTELRTEPVERRTRTQA